MQEEEYEAGLEGDMDYLYKRQRSLEWVCILLTGVLFLMWVLGLGKKKSDEPV